MKRQWTIFLVKILPVRKKIYLFTLCYWIKIIMIPLTSMMVGFSDRVVIMWCGRWCMIKWPVVNEWLEIILSFNFSLLTCYYIFINNNVIVFYYSICCIYHLNVGGLKQILTCFKLYCFSLWLPLQLSDLLWSHTCRKLCSVTIHGS